jgi:glycerophosphoryl diester phosphodiesterase
VETIEKSTFAGNIIIQSFELDSLLRVIELQSEWPTVKLMTHDDFLSLEEGTFEAGGGGSGGGFGSGSGGGVGKCYNLDTYLEQLKGIGVHGIGPDKRSIVPDPENPPESSMLVEMAHKHGLYVHPYTFKSDVTGLDRVYGGNAAFEFARFFELGVDGVFADFPDHAVFARELYNRSRLNGEHFKFV